MGRGYFFFGGGGQLLGNFPRKKWIEQTVLFRKNHQMHHSDSNILHDKDSSAHETLIDLNGWVVGWLSRIN